MLGRRRLSRTVPPGVRAWVAGETGATVDRARRLPGASTTAVHRLDLSNGMALVVRRYLWPGFLQEEPAAPRPEVDALRFARHHHLAVPEVVAADLTGAEVGDGVPAVLMTFLRGRAVGVPDLERLAEVAAAVHDVEPDGLGHVYFPWYRENAPGPTGPTTRPELLGRRHRAVAARHAAVPADVHPPGLPSRERAVVEGCTHGHRRLGRELRRPRATAPPVAVTSSSPPIPRPRWAGATNSRATPDAHAPTIPRTAAVAAPNFGALSYASVVLRIEALDHIVLVVEDVERSVAWYSDVLGLDVLRFDEWKAGDAPFPSVRVNEGTIIDILAGPRTGTNVDHLCLVVAPTDLGALAATGRFEVVEGPVTRWGARGDGTSLYVTDPDGNVVELRHYG